MSNSRIRRYNELCSTSIYQPTELHVIKICADIYEHIVTVIEIAVE